jgi:alpha-amylase
MARRPEIYHEKIRNAAMQGNFNFAEQTKSIHDVVRVKEPGLEKALVYDWHRRVSLLDHFLGEDTTLEKFSNVAYQEVGDFVLGNYHYFPKKSTRELNLRLSREGMVSGTPIKIEKNLSLFANQSVVSIEYEVSNLGAEKKALWFAPEFNFSLLAPKAQDRYYEIEGKELEDRTLASRGEEEAVHGIKLVDNWNQFAVSLRWEKTARLWRFPIETVSQSEGGFEKTFQNSVIVPSWKIVLEPLGKWKVRITLLIEE